MCESRQALLVEPRLKTFSSSILRRMLVAKTRALHCGFGPFIFTGHVHTFSHHLAISGARRLYFSGSFCTLRSMIMQRVISRHFPFDSFERWSNVWTTLNSVSCFLVFPRSRLKRQFQCVNFPCRTRHVSLMISADSHVLLSLT